MDWGLHEKGTVLEPKVNHDLKSIPMATKAGYGHPGGLSTVPILSAGGLGVIFFSANAPCQFTWGVTPQD